jgi:hypothetical protein
MLIYHYKYISSAKQKLYSIEIIFCFVYFGVLRKNVCYDGFHRQPNSFILFQQLSYATIAIIMPLYICIFSIVSFYMLYVHNLVEYFQI